MWFLWICERANTRKEQGFSNALSPVDAFGMPGIRAMWSVLGVQDRRGIDNVQHFGRAFARDNVVNEHNRSLSVGHSVMMPEPAHVADFDVVQIAEPEIRWQNATAFRRG